ncbi:MAG: hypothetical protein ACLUW6_03735 [Coriobacteriaceae bacterium]
MLPHTATRKGWNRSFGLARPPPAARQSSSSASASHGCRRRRGCPTNGERLVGPRALLQQHLLDALLVEHHRVAPEQKRQLGGDLVQCASRSATSGYMAS